MKRLPFTLEEITVYSDELPTPYYIYDEDALRERARRMFKAFQWGDPMGFTNYFAVKATPNPHILKILREEGMGADCSSIAELLLAHAAGFRGERIMFTSNNTPAEAYKLARDMGCVITIDNASHLPFLVEQFGQLPELLSFRYNPGPLHIGECTSIIGEPEESKFGMTHCQVLESISLAQKHGTRRFGLHTMVVSNSLNISNLQLTASMLLKLAREVEEKRGVAVEFVNFGGGIGIPYRPNEKEISIEDLSRQLQMTYEELIKRSALHPLRFLFECGRWVSGPAGCLVTRVIHQKNTYRKYLGVDTSTAHLVRPAMYKDAYHRITHIQQQPDLATTRACDASLPRSRNIFNDEAAALTKPGVFDVVGDLCENNDKLGEERPLGEVRIGDLLVIHDTGAHGHAMGHNYNGKLRPAEYLKTATGEVVEIRRGETFDDLFRTLREAKSPWRIPLAGRRSAGRTVARALVVAAVAGAGIALALMRRNRK
eukprot:Polyplicarium_translucidae@DN2677_c0_g2_i2.p1